MKAKNRLLPLQWVNVSNFTLRPSPFPLFNSSVKEPNTAVHKTVPTMIHRSLLLVFTLPLFSLLLWPFSSLFVVPADHRFFIELASSGSDWETNWMFGGNLTLSVGLQPFDCNCSTGVCSLSPTLTANFCSQGVCAPPPSPPPLSPSLSPPSLSFPNRLVHCCLRCLSLPLTLCPVCTSEHPFPVCSPSLSLSPSLSVAKDQLCQGLFFCLQSPWRWSSF